MSHRSLTSLSPVPLALRDYRGQTTKSRGVTFVKPEPLAHVQQARKEYLELARKYSVSKSDTPGNGESPTATEIEWSGSELTRIEPRDSISVTSFSPKWLAYQETSKNNSRVMVWTKNERSSSGPSRSSGIVKSLTKLSFVEKLPNLSGLPHFRLILDENEEQKEARIKTYFGHAFMSLSPFNSINYTKPKEINDSVDGRGGSTSGSSSGSSGTNSDQNRTQTPGGARTNNQPRPGAGLHVPVDNPEYPPCPPNTPEHYRNRFFEVKKSLFAGYGAFASRDLKKGETILVEPALFHANGNTLYDELDKLTPSLKQAFDSMHANPLLNAPEQYGIFLTNSFQTLGNKKQGVFLIAARFNHACRPKNNIEYVYDQNPRVDNGRAVIVEGNY